MGKHDYKEEPVINVNYLTAIRQLNRFFPENINKDNLHVERLKRAVKTASLKIVNYQIDTKVNMEKVELLRDVIFIGTSFLETTNNNHTYYRAVIACAFDIIEKTLDVTFTDDFIHKINTSKNIYFDTQFNTVAFYLLFKSHLRYAINIKEA